VVKRVTVLPSLAALSPLIAVSLRDSPLAVAQSGCGASALLPLTARGPRSTGYSIPRWMVASGGATSSAAGSYTLGGASGQPHAGVLAGGFGGAARWPRPGTKSISPWSFASMDKGTAPRGWRTLSRPPLAGSRSRRARGDPHRLQRPVACSASRHSSTAWR
jgi:hypothetical protein